MPLFLSTLVSELCCVCFNSGEFWLFESAAHAVRENASEAPQRIRRGPMVWTIHDGFWRGGRIGERLQPLLASEGSS